jgi:Big-like domain-containing protein
MTRGLVNAEPPASLSAIISALMSWSRIVALGAAVSVASACGSGAPTGPSPSPPGRGFVLACNAPTLLAGDLVVCAATVGLANVSTSAIWTSSDPNIATSLGFGAFMGKAEGQATVTATYSGQSVSAPLTVHLEDTLGVSAAAVQGSFKVGTTATLWLQGFYGVASADSGTLTLVVTDQAGAIVSTSTPLTVPRGGDRYLISTTFTLSPGMTRVCRTAVLQIGSKTLTVVPDASLMTCFDVMP